MPKLLQREHTYYVPTETYLCEPASDSTDDIEAELAQIPSTAPAGSIAEIFLSTGLSVKMKTIAGQWV
jgi:hypothetical protein